MKLIEWIPQRTSKDRWRVRMADGVILGIKPENLAEPESQNSVSLRHLRYICGVRKAPSQSWDITPPVASAHGVGVAHPSPVVGLTSPARAARLFRVHGSFWNAKSLIGSIAYVP